MYPSEFCIILLLCNSVCFTVTRVTPTEHHPGCEHTGREEGVCHQRDFDTQTKLYSISVGKCSQCVFTKSCMGSRVTHFGERGPALCPHRALVTTTL